MFTHLVASEKQNRRTVTPGTAVVSLILHAFLVGGVVYATIQGPQVIEKEEELVEFMEIEEKAPEPIKEEPPPPPPPEAPPETPPPPKGFQALVPPQEPPPVIPDIDTSAPAVSADDFSGIGQIGGTAKGVTGGTPQPTAKDEGEGSPGFAYEVAVLERKPELTNKSQVASLMQRLYPRMLQDAGIGGQVMMQFVIDADGKVDASTVKVIDASHDQFADASVKAVERFRFRPGRYKGQNVRVLIQMPITWQPER